MSEKLTQEEKKLLLKLARQALEDGVRGLPFDKVVWKGPVNRWGYREIMVETGGRRKPIVGRQSLPPLDPSTLTPALRADGASFVTLTVRGELRGCVGALEPGQSLVEDVREHAIAAALQDYRFPPVEAHELAKIEIEVSRLSLPEPLEYTTPEDLLARLRPGVDGVILQDGFRRATFLPQVWEKVADKEEFLSHLCLKMGASPELWRRKHLEVLVYQVEEFCE